MSRSSWVDMSLLAFKGFCAGIMFITAVVTIYTVGPSLETRYWPAVSKLRILDLSENSEGHAVIHAEFTKLRASCKYVGIAWFRGAPEGGFERVAVILMRPEGDTSSPNRPIGTQRAGPWIVQMPADEITGNSFARLSHSCNPFWTTITDFWP